MQYIPKRQGCNLLEAPFEDERDANESIRAHEQIFTSTHKHLLMAQCAK
jgi:hypothetical protein